MSSWDFWDDLPILTNMIEAYRRDRDPAQLIRFIELNHEAMRSPQIGRLFLDILSGRLPPLNNREVSTTEIRERAVDLVFFYVGQGLNKSNAYTQAAKHLPKTNKYSRAGKSQKHISGDTVKGYVKRWIEKRLSEKWNGTITLKEFWENPEKYTQHGPAFYHGKTMIDDELAQKAVIRAGCPDMSIKEYRQIINDLYENGKPVDYGEPWEAAKKEARLALESQRFNAEKNRE
jgi:hypothetical protein